MPSTTPALHDTKRPQLRLVSARQPALPFPAATSTVASAWRPGTSGRRLLRIALRYGYVTRDLAALAYTHAHPRGVGATHIRDELTHLVRAGYLARFTRPVDPRSGSRQHVYTATVRSAHLFDGEHAWSPPALKAIANRANNPHREYEHELGVALLRILWDAGSKPYTDPENPEQFRFQTIAYWDQPHTFTVRAGEKTTAKVRPDTTIVLHRHYTEPHRTHYRRIHVELERTRKNLQRTEARFRFYRELLADPDGQAARTIEAGVGVRPTKASAIFIAADPNHQAQLLSSAATALEIERVRRQRKTESLPELWFSNLEALITRTTTFDADGHRRAHEQIIQPRQLFDAPLFVNLHGEAGTLLDLRP